MRSAWIFVVLVAVLALSSPAAAKKDKAKAKKKTAPADEGPPMPPKDETWKKKPITDYKYVTSASLGYLCGNRFHKERLRCCFLGY